jgi:hypothetical protein
LAVTTDRVYDVPPVFAHSGYAWLAPFCFFNGIDKIIRLILLYQAKYVLRMKIAIIGNAGSGKSSRSTFLETWIG